MPLPRIVPLGDRSNRTNRALKAIEALVQNSLVTSNGSATWMHDLNQTLRKQTELKQYRDILRRMVCAHWQWQNHPLPAHRERFSRLQQLYRIIDGSLKDIPYDHLVRLHQILKNTCRVMIKEADAVAATHPDIRDLLFMANEKENIPI